MKEHYKILLVDDEEEVRKSIIKKINWEEEGFLVVGDAENGVEALEKIENLNPDLVFTDIRMPYMDGLELIKEINIRYPLIKSKSSNPEKIIDFISGYQIGRAHV